MAKSTNLVVGCGYLGHRVARLWQARGERVMVVTRSPDRAAQFSAEGFEPIVADITSKEACLSLPAIDTVLFAVGYGRNQSLPMRDVFAGGLSNVLAALPADTARVIYISSTGVYGDVAGDWVDEDSPCEPSRKGGRACLAAEQQLAAHPLGTCGIVLRLAGIYGPGRVPRRDELMAGSPIIGNSDGYLNLIHVDDAALVILAADERAKPPRTFIVSDGNPLQRRAYYEELARLVNAPPPRFESVPADASERRRGSSDKRVSNARMLAELDVKLQYPSFREGLAAIVNASRE